MSTISESKTFELFKSLLGKNFNVNLNVVYANNYNQDYSYLSIFLFGPISEVRLNKLYNLSKEFEIIVSKTIEGEVFYEIRKHRVFAELVKIEGVDYNKTLLRETTPTDNVSIYNYEDWRGFYKETPLVWRLEKNNQKAVELFEQLRDRRELLLKEKTAIKFVEFTLNNKKDSFAIELLQEEQSGVNIPEQYLIYEGISLDEHLVIWKKKYDGINLIK